MLEFLRLVQGTLKPLLDSIGEGVLVTDTGGAPLVWNAAAERILGVGTLRENGEPWTERSGVCAADGTTPLPGRDRPLPRAMRGETVIDQEITVQQSSGGALLLSCTAKPLRDPAGNIVGGVTIFRDIGAQRHAATALRESEHLYRTLAANLPATIVMMYGPDLHFTLAAGAGLSAAGLTSGQIEGSAVAEYATPSLLGAEQTWWISSTSFSTSTGF